MKKIKSQYRNSITESSEDYTWAFYPNIRSGVHKRFSTKQEKSYYFLHVIERRYLGLPIKIRAARGGVLPSAWDDLPSIVCDLAKSWKHNSKRRNQYYK